MAQINGKVGARAIGAGPLPVCSATEKGFGVWYWCGEGEGGCGACVEGGRGLDREEPTMGSCGDVEAKSTGEAEREATSESGAGNLKICKSTL